MSKRGLVPRGLVFVFALFLAGSASPGWAGIAGGPHDFSQMGWSGGSLCVVCHTPHGADTTTTEGPLWNHRPTAQTFTVYSSRTLTATDVGQPTGTSKLCLSCHDGTVAIDSYGSNDGSWFMGGPKAVGLGGDLSDDHPISFVYDSSLASADGMLHDPAARSSGLGGTIEQDLLENRRLECSSCHDVHDGDADNHLLRVTLSGSMLCLTCHDM